MNSDLRLQVAHNEQVLAMAGQLKNVKPGRPKPNCSCLPKLKAKSQIANVQPEQKTNSEVKPIASTSRPAIANTLVMRRLLFASVLQNMCPGER